MATTANNPWANSPTPPAAPQEDTADGNTQPPQAPVNPLLSNSSNPLLPGDKPAAPVFNAQPQAEDKTAEDTAAKTEQAEDKPAEQAEDTKAADAAAKDETKEDTKTEDTTKTETKDETKAEDTKDEPAKKPAKKSTRRKSRAKSTKSKAKDASTADTDTIDEVTGAIKDLARQLSDNFAKLGTLAPAQAIEAIDAADKDDESIAAHLDDLTGALEEYNRQREFISGKRRDLRSAYEQVVTAFKDIETAYDDADK